MGKGGQTQNQNSTSTTSTQIDPWYMTQGQANYQQAADAINNWSPVLRQNPAGFTQDQLRAQDIVRQDGGYSPLAAAAFADAKSLTDKMANFTAPTVGTYTYTPYTTSDARRDELMKPISQYQFKNPAEFIGGGPVDVGGYSAVGVGAVGAASVADIMAQQIEAAKINRGDIRDVQGGSIADELEAYLAAMDPSYTEAVLNPALSDIERNRQMVQQQNASSAAKAGAFGGSRHGIVESETNRAYADQVAKSTGDLRMNYFNTVLTSLKDDLARRMQAGLANQQVDYNTASSNANLLQQANIANQQADLEAKSSNQRTQAQLSATNASNAQSAANASAAAQNQAMAASAAARAQAALQYQSLFAQAGMMNENNRAQFANNIVAGNLGVEGSNASSLNAAGQFNAGQQTQADQLNALNSINTAQNVWSPAVTNYLNVGTAQQGLWQTGVNNLNSSGAQQQAYDQAVLDNDYANQIALNSAPLTQAALLQQALAGTPYNTSTTSSGNSTTQVQQNPGALGIASGLAGLMFMSDKRLKKNVRPMKGALESLRNMNGVEYDWKGGGPDAGLLAQDVERAVPGGAPSIGGVKHVSVPHVLGLLTESVKELDSKVKSVGKKKKEKKNA